MIRVYLLPVQTINGTDIVAGIEFIHDALLLCTEKPDIRKLIQDTTTTEHNGLIAAKGVLKEVSQEDIDRYNSQVIITAPDPDTERAKELLANSPDVISQPGMCELLRIFGKRLGYQ